MGHFRNNVVFPIIATCIQAGFNYQYNTRRMKAIRDQKESALHNTPAIQGQDSDEWTWVKHDELVYRLQNDDQGAKYVEIAYKIDQDPSGKKRSREWWASMMIQQWSQNYGWGEEGKRDFEWLDEFERQEQERRGKTITWKYRPKIRR